MVYLSRSPSSAALCIGWSREIKEMISITYIDHYDSFTFNLIDWLQEAPYPVAIKRVPFDDEEAMAALASERQPLVLSPGPKSPQEALATRRLVAKKLAKVPILGVCLGHQILADVAGLPAIKSQVPRHGALKKILIQDDGGLFAGMGLECEMAAYHSLVAAHRPLGLDWQVTARCELGEVQAIEYRPRQGAAAFGVQFHPESFLSQNAAGIRENWYRCLETWQRQGVKHAASAQEIGRQLFSP